MTGAIVHEWIEPVGGAEDVVDGMVTAFPDADLYCLWNDSSDRYPDHCVYESPLAQSWFRHHKAMALPLMPYVWRRIEQHRNYDWLLISSHLFAHHARFLKHPNIPKYVYAHTPARYIWNPEIDPRGQALPIRAAAVPLRILDRHRAQEITAIAANSEFVQERIRAAWGLDSRVIYPPVDVERIVGISDWSSVINDSEAGILGKLPSGFVLGASRFVRYKRLDLVIRTAQILDMPVVIAGSGPEETALRTLAADARVPVSFVTAPSSALLFSIFQQASVLVFPAIEDFGIMPVEAMAAGCPVAALSQGGTVETIIEGTSGALANDQSPSSLARAVETAWLCERARIPATVGRFSSARFVSELRTWMGTGEQLGGTER